MIPVINESYAGLPAGTADPAARRRAVRRALVHLPTQYVFSGQLAIGWRLYWESAKIHPYDTVSQRRTLALIVRTLLGRRGYEIVGGWFRAAKSGRLRSRRRGERVAGAGGGLEA